MRQALFRWCDLMLRTILNGPYSYSPTHRLLEIMALAGFFSMLFLMSWQLYDIASTLNVYWTWFLLIKMLLLGYVAADFFSGLVHWMGDTFGEEDWPILGAGFIKPFRDHHVDPKGITHHDFIEVNGNNCFVLLLALVPVSFIMSPDWGYISFATIAFAMFFSIGIFLTNQFHKWSHLTEPNIAIATLQRWNIILSPENHDVHHAAPYKTYYCITCGWLNPVLDRTDFWRSAERFIGFFTGRNYAKTTH